MQLPGASNIHQALFVHQSQGTIGTSKCSLPFPAINYLSSTVPLSSQPANTGTILPAQQLLGGAYHQIIAVTALSPVQPAPPSTHSQFPSLSVSASTPQTPQSIRFLPPIVLGHHGPTWLQQVISTSSPSPAQMPASTFPILMGLLDSEDEPGVSSPLSHKQQQHQRKAARNTKPTADDIWSFFSKVPGVDSKGCPMVTAICKLCSK